MYAVVGPVHTQAYGYAFDVWTPETGLCAGFLYPRVQDAHYARRVEIRQHCSGGDVPARDCETIDDFVAEIAAVTAQGRA
jgi:hypothetical protein